VAPTSRLAGPLISQDRPWIGRGDPAQRDCTCSWGAYMKGKAADLKGGGLRYLASHTSKNEPSNRLAERRPDVAQRRRIGTRLTNMHTMSVLN